MKRQAGYIIFIAVFLLLCLVPSAGMLLADRGDGSSGANEVLSALPALRDGEGGFHADYLAQLSAYVEDNYFLRQELVTAWSALNHRVFRTSISEDVVLGRDGWLYFGGTLEDYTGSRPLDEGEIAGAARNLALMREYCEGLGARFLFTIAPNKNSMYPEHMPALPVFSARRSADSLREALAAEGVDYLDLFAVFGGQSETLYFPRDSHWNSRGAALAADSVNAALGRSSGYFSGPFSPQTVHRGDLYAMLYPAGEELDTDMVYGGALEFTYDAPIRSAENLTILTSGSREGSLLMFRDSFGNLLYPYLADSFGRALFSRATAYRLNLAGEREADCVVVELVERNLRYLLENVPVMPAPLREAPEARAEGDTSVSLLAEPSQELDGYALVSGTLPWPPAPGGSILLRADSACYEAFRLAENGFGLYLPASALAAGELSVVYDGAAVPVRMAPAESSSTN